MRQQIDIPIGKGTDAYLVTISGENLRDSFANASLKDKEGEALVEAIVALGGVSKIKRRKGGEYNDGPHGEPGIVQFNDNGTPRAIRHFKNGGLDKAAKDELSVLQFDHDGKRLVYAALFADGKRIKRLTDQELATDPRRFCNKSIPKI